MTSDPRSVVGVCVCGKGFGLSPRWVPPGRVRAPLGSHKGRGERGKALLDGGGRSELRDCRALSSPPSLPPPPRGRGGGREGRDRGGEGPREGREGRDPAPALPLLFGRRPRSLRERRATAQGGPRPAPRPETGRGGGGGRRVLGTTLGRACSRGCRERKVRSKIGWLAGSRDSHHVSRFAAFFILARAEISVDGSCFGVFSFFALLFCRKEGRGGGGEEGREGGGRSPPLPDLRHPPPIAPPFSSVALPREEGGMCCRGFAEGGPPPPSRLPPPPPPFPPSLREGKGEGGGEGRDGTGREAPTLHVGGRAKTSRPRFEGDRDPRLWEEHPKRRGDTPPPPRMQKRKNGVNDPSAGSPTETLLRLLLPLNGKVQPTSSNPATRLPGSRTGRAPRASPDRSIGRSDGRCVQRAGT